MSQLNLLLLHVEPQARAEQHFDLQPTANVSVSCLFGVFTMSTSHFSGKVFKIQQVCIFRKDKLVDCLVIAELLKNSPVLPKMFQ